jgi:exosome complex RNA-binding protein Rrp42 (RNase PH superfamily)
MAKKDIEMRLFKLIRPKRNYRPYQMVISVYLVTNLVKLPIHQTLEEIMHLFRTALLLFLLVPFGLVTAQTARLQVIHNAADPAADSVDIYLNGTLLLDNFKFRAATPFIDAPAGVTLNIGVAPASSHSVSDTVKNFQVTLSAGEKYVAIANGVLNPAGFAVNPDGRSTAFTLFIKTMAQESGSGGNVEFAAVHGATDAPSVDVVARGIATLVDNVSYGDITPYIGVPPAKYLLDVKDSTGTTRVATFSADLSGLANGAAIVFASGFLNPMANQNGKAFGIYAALPTGQVVEFPPVTTARVQVIHNAADPAADSVDVYLGAAKLLDNFKFRTATPFIDAPAGSQITIGVAPATSSSVADTLAGFRLTLTPGETYVAIANGMLNPANFAANPDGRSTGFTLFIKTMAQESGSGGNVEFAAVHGATDAPAVDVVARGVATLVDNAAYGDITPYIAVPPAKYLLDVKDSSGTTRVATFSADLSGLANGAAIVFASGFLNPSANQNGKAFGLYAALPTGHVVAFPPVTTARVQVIHNAADPAADSVDVYLGAAKLLDNFKFRTATPFIDAPAGSPIDIGVAGSASSSAADTLKNFRLTLTPGETYVVLADGVLNPANFAPNPNGRSTAFNLFIQPMGQEEAKDTTKVDFFVMHGATDAPGVQVVARGVGTLVNIARYGDITGYIAVPPAAYTLDVKDSSGSVTVASFNADLSALRKGAAAVFASGFLNPSANQNGPAFGLYAALPNGTVVNFGPVTSVETQPGNRPLSYALSQNYPNPFNPTTQITFSVPQQVYATLVVYNTIGQEAAVLANGTFAPGTHQVSFNAAGLPSGTYFYRIQAGEFSSTKKMLLIK